jgi:putative inorganic carbon (hco3(-)) transporter
MGSLGFGLFVALTGVLVLRPADLIGALEGWPVYEATIALNLGVLLPRVLDQFRPASLAARPISLCVVGLLVAVPMSHLGRLELGPSPGAAFEFLKVVLSFLLMLAAVDTTRRLRAYLRWLALFLLALASLALAQYHGLIDNAALAPVAERVTDKQAGTTRELLRLQGVGIFGNPNDLSRVLAVGILIGLYFLCHGGPARVLWLVPLGVFGYALQLTHSRGGLLALLASLFVLLLERLGRTRGLLLGALLLPALVLAVGGRQADLTTDEGTGQKRIQHWSDGFEALRSSPLFGVGVGRYEEHAGGLGAHNSFVHGYVELGLFGGTLFTGAVYSAVWLLGRPRRPAPPADRDLERLRPFIRAVVAGYAVGLLSSSRCYVIPTYLLLGLAAVFLRLAAGGGRLPAARVRPAFVLRLAAVSAAVLVLLQGFVVLSVRWDVK